MMGLALVAVGGGIGAAARHALGGWIARQAPGWRLPLGTLAVNVLGCLLAGVLAGTAEKHGGFSREVRLFLFTGLLGGFTTFSAFGMETMAFLERRAFLLAGLNVVLSVSAGLLALWLGTRAAS